MSFESGRCALQIQSSLHLKNNQIVRKTQWYNKWKVIITEPGTHSHYHADTEGRDGDADIGGKVITETSKVTTTLSISGSSGSWG